jgi:hypothetical protein
MHGTSVNAWISQANECDRKRPFNGIYLSANLSLALTEVGNFQEESGMALDVFCTGFGGCATLIRMKIPCGSQLADECDESFNIDVSDLPDSSAS